MRYIERNPVRAGIVKKAGDFEWSSARYHLDGGPDPLVRKSPALELMPEWRKFLGDEPEEETDRIRLHSHSGRPLGENSWIKRMETRLSRTLLPKKGGRPRKISEEN
jgi:putative transposase